MPWKEMTIAMSRLDFVKRAAERIENFSDLCKEFDISRPTGYKWLNRYLQGEDLEDRDKTPFHQPRRTPPEIESKVLSVREQYPGIGSRKIARILQNHGETSVPSPSTITEILRRNGLITPEASAAATPYRRFAMEHPNDMWQTDYKGHFPLLNGVECHPLNIIDDCSRYCLCSRAMVNETFETFQPVLIEMFQTYGLPRAFLSDNGNPWGSGTRNAFSRVDVWLMQLGILPMHGRILHPQTQGKCESYNRSLTRELLRYRRFSDEEDAGQELEKYRRFYNEIRPHHAMNLDVPAKYYEHSSHAYPGKITEWEYPSWYKKIRVGRSGHFKYRGHEYYLGEALHNETVGMRESHKAGCVTLEYREFRIARIRLEDHGYDFKYPRWKQEEAAGR